MTVDEIKQLMESFKELGLAEMSVSVGDTNIELKAVAGEPVVQAVPLAFENRTAAPVVEPLVIPNRKITASQTVNAQTGQNAETTSISANAVASAENTETVDSGVPVRAELAGVFYRASAPGEKPYTEVGATVKEGQTIGLIEAMKMMSEIPAPCNGVVREILVKDAEFAEYNAPIMVIDPA